MLLSTVWLLRSLLMTHVAFSPSVAFQVVTRLPPRNIGTVQSSSSLWNHHPQSSTVASTKPAMSTLQHACKFCNRTFSSRNELFRHLRNTEEDCAASSQARTATISNGEVITTTKVSLAVEFSYHFRTFGIIKEESSSIQDVIENDGMPSEAAIAGNVVEQALQESLTTILGGDKDHIPDIELVSCSQTSVARNRHGSLTQESGCAAARDVLISTWSVPASIANSNLGVVNATRMELFLEDVLSQTNKILCLNDSDRLAVSVNACKWLPRENKHSKRILNAESDCSQRIYRYLLPLEWLSAAHEESSLGQILNGTDFLSDESVLFSSEPIRNFQRVLKASVSPAMPNRRTRRKSLQVDNSNGQDAASEKGAKNHLGPVTHADPIALRAPLKTSAGSCSRYRRPWHNFCDPRLRGNASPNNQMVWRTIERAQIVDFIGMDDSSSSTKVHAVLEFRGDDFCREQIRRIVGTAIAVSNGWLPENFIELATRADSWFETPVAPDGRLYLHQTGFYVDQSRSKKGLFEHGGVAHAENYCDANTVLQNSLLSQRAHSEAMEEEKVWLHSLEYDVCPRIQIQVDKSMTKNSGSVSRLADEEMRKLDPAPAKYRRTLFLLSEILQSKKWPQTSAARSTVIKDLYLEHDTDIEGSQLGGRLIGGSFTVVNPKAVPVNYDLPLANSLFHDLVDAVFELEESLALSELPRADESGGKSIDAAGSRTASTHCAINANAAFTPHVDSGKGLGQSLSMIVGLGDYIGGDLMIEGHGYDIRYEPLQFDGWRLRHWTDQYQGQRFSLVWFSPATGTTENSVD